MQISFFEEFPTKENLAKIKYISFPTKLYIAAHSLEEFQKIKIPSKKVKEKIYWPILKREEGYWFSPFSKTQAIERILSEIEHKNISVMIDSELPTHPNPYLYLTQFPFFFYNRKKMRNFIASHPKVYTAEYFPSSRFFESLFQFLGLSFTTKNHCPIKMIYSSCHDFGEDFIRTEIKQAKNIYGKRLRIALGTLTHGIKGDEPAISIKMLERDLNICNKLNIEEVILFRLGGMNKEYKKIILKFV